MSIEMPPWASFSEETGILTGTPRNKDVGVAINDIVISVTDSLGEKASLDSFNLTIVNEPLKITGTPDPTVVEEGEYSFTPTVTDVEDIKSFSIVNRPGWAIFDTDTGQLKGTPPKNYVGVETGIVISVTDGHQSVSLAEFDIEITNVNDAPTISGSPITDISEGVGYEFIPVVNDVDVGADLILSVQQLPVWLGVDFDPWRLTGTPVEANADKRSKMSQPAAVEPPSRSPVLASHLPAKPYQLRVGLQAVLTTRRPSRYRSISQAAAGTVFQLDDIESYHP